MLIYDIHSHLGTTSSGEANSAALMVEELKDFKIAAVGVSSLSGTSVRDSNNLIHKAMCEFPDFVQGYAFINPKSKDAIDEIDRCIGELGMIGVKFHSAKHGFYPDNTPQLLDIFKRIEHYGVHVQMHVGTAPFSTPYTWCIWAKRFPNIDFVFSHIGYYDFGLSTICAVLDIKNIWVETSGQFDVTVLKTALKTLGSKRICFGTDWPYKPLNIELSKFLELDLKDSEAEDIFYKNAKYLWRL